MVNDRPSVPEMCDVVVSEVVAMMNIKMAIKVFFYQLMHNWIVSKTILNLH